VKALVITKSGGPEVLKVEERPDPGPPGPGEVAVDVKAAGINFADEIARAGLYPDAPKPPCVVGYEIAGTVSAVGDGVEDLAPGDRVAGGTRFGGYAERVVTTENALVPLPEGWSFEEGASFPVNYATAYAGLVRFGSLRPGEKVLLQAAAGGVGIAATQVAKIVGAEVFGTASPSKHEACRGFGVDHVIDYRNQDFVKEVRRIAGEKEPLDLVMDAVAGRSFRKGWSLLGPGGRLVCFGASALVSGEKRNPIAALRTIAGMPPFNVVPMMSNSKSVIGLNMLKLWDAKGSLDEYIDPLSEWVADGRLRPVVAETFPLERGADAHRFILERRNVGKVVLTV
jgi:NADPH:quinone reductase-like Zn-dependent oxidoreductase